MQTKINIFLSTLSVILCFAGYPFVTSIFSSFMSADIEGSSRLVTVPYRAFCCVIALLVIFLNIKEKFRLKPVLKVLIIYWVMILVRFWIDMYYRTDIYIEPALKNKTLLLMVCILLPTIALMKSYRYVNLRLCLKWIYLFLATAIVISYFSNEALQGATEERLSFNTALSSISAGHVGLSTLILSLYLLFKGELSKFKKVLVIFIMVLSFLMWLRAGSRGPILTGLVVFAIFVFAKMKDNVRGFVVMIVIMVVGYLCLDLLMNLLKDVSPILYNRFMGKSGNQLDTREDLYEYAINIFISHPILGKNFAIYGLRYGEMIYSHNAFLDSLMMLGLVGGVMFVYIVLKCVFKFIRMIRTHDRNAWIGLILLQYLMFVSVSGAFYQHIEITVGIFLLFMRENNYNYSLNQNNVISQRQTLAHRQRVRVVVGQKKVTQGD